MTFERKEQQSHDRQVQAVTTALHGRGQAESDVTPYGSRAKNGSLRMRLSEPFEAYRQADTVHVAHEHSPL